MLCVVSLVTVCFLLPEARATSVSVPSTDAETISAAILKASAGDTVWVSDGVYREHVMLTHGVALMARSRFKATIDGGGRGTVVTLGKSNVISGFEIRNGTIGLFSNGAGNVIRSCRIVRNWQTGIVCVRHLPLIEDNIIAFNRSSGFQGWDVRSSSAGINHNTIAFNGNHGIAVGGSSSFIVENNIIAFNERFGLHVLEDAKNVRVANNNLYRNLNAPGGMPEGNFSFDPAFIAPRATMNFQSDPKRCCTIKGTDNENLGARLGF
jgi:nitrous oxidase accessory protein NosD